VADPSMTSASVAEGRSGQSGCRFLRGDVSTSHTGDSYAGFESFRVWRVRYSQTTIGEYPTVVSSDTLRIASEVSA